MVEIIRTIEKKLKQAFAKIKEEFDEHRDAINQNTNEIQYNYEFLCRLDAKIEKLGERIDEISMFIHAQNPAHEVVKADVANMAKELPCIMQLTSKEKEVFVVLYSYEGELTYKELSERTALGENLVVCYVTNLIAKGIPVAKRYINSEVRLHIDQEFKTLQAKNNLVALSELDVKNVRV